MRRRNKNKTSIIILSVSLVLLFSIGYAAFNTKLTVTGEGNIKKYAAELLKENVVTVGDGLYIDEDEENRYVYKGANPDNYIKFNNELWRIIGIEADNTLKIIKNQNVGAMAWDENNSPIWETSSINSYLNTTFYNQITTQYKTFIANHDFSIGKIYIKWEDSVATTSIRKDMEKEKSKLWKGNIGLINVTDFLKATTSKDCVSARGSWISDTDMPCKIDNWLDKEEEIYWTINPNDVGPESSVYNLIWTIHGYVGAYPANKNYNDENLKDMLAYPVLYLKSSLVLTGNGNKENPYQIVFG